MIIAKWELRFILDMWLKKFRNEKLDKIDYMVTSGSGTADMETRTIQWRWSHKNPENGIMEYVLGWRMIEDKLEIFSGVIRTEDKDDDTAVLNPGYRATSKEYESNVNITFNSNGGIFHDDNSKFDAFPREDMEDLFQMLKYPDKTIDNYYREHPKYEYDKNLQMLRYEVKEYKDRSTKIEFIASDKIIPKNGLYIGFEVDGDNGYPPIHYVFKVTNKKYHFPSYYSTPDKNQNMASYEAKFHGYYAPSEEDIRNADFKWIINEEIISQANHEARYT